MADAVLLTTDIAADRYPTACVITGQATARATHLWAIASRRADRIVALFGIVGVWAGRAVGRNALRVPIPVSTPAYRTWRRRATTWAAMTCSGLGFVAVSPLRGGPSLAAFGVAVMAASVMFRSRAHRELWVSAELRPAEGLVVIHRAHPSFDKQARDLFVRHLNR